MSRIDIPSILQQALKEIDLDMKSWSLAAGMSETTVRDIITGRAREPKLATLEKLAEAIDLDLVELLGIRGTAPLVGRVGAGEAIYPHDDYPKGQGWAMVPVPAGLEGAIVVEVVGDSMFPVYWAGDLVFILRQRDGVPRSAIGQECVVQVTGDAALIKTIRRGTEAGRFDLISYNAPPMENQRLDWASPVLFVDRRARFKRAA